MSFGHQKAKYFWGLHFLSPHQGPAMDPPGGLKHHPDSQLLFALCTFCAHTIWVPLVLPMSTFFSVLTPEHFGIKDSIKDIPLEEMFKMMYKNDLSEPALPSSKIMMSSNEVSAED